jgi:hypothetical protein
MKAPYLPVLEFSKLRYYHNLREATMGSQNSPTGLLVRYFTFFAILWLSSIILTIAFSQAILSVLTSEATSASISPAVVRASISIVFADGALLAYSVILPLFSLIYLTICILRTSSPDIHGTIANPIVLLFSILMSYGWLINTGFWTLCEIYEADGKVCPIKTRRLVMSTPKVVLSCFNTVAFFTHTVVTAMEILNINKTAQQARKARLCGNVQCGNVQEMAEHDDNVAGDKTGLQGVWK